MGAWPWSDVANRLGSGLNRLSSLKHDMRHEGDARQRSFQAPIKLLGGTLSIMLQPDEHDFGLVLAVLVAVVGLDWLAARLPPLVFRPGK